MKKFLTVILLLIFCSVHAVWAVEIGSNDFSNIQVDKKVMEDKTTEIEKYITNASKELTEVESILVQYGYSKKDNSKKSKKEFMKLNLLDGDYVIGFKNAPYFAEYHKNGNLMGLVKVEEVVMTEEKVIQIFYEYRTGYNVTSGMGLKHIMYLDIEKDKYISQYIYDVDGKMLCMQVNNDIYVAEEAKNIIPDLSKKRVSSVKIYNGWRKIQEIREFCGDMFTVITLPLWLVPLGGALSMFIGYTIIGGKSPSEYMK